MIRILRNTLLVLLAALCFGCACAAAEMETAPAVIQPEPIGLSMDALAGKTVMVRVGAYHQEDHTLELTVLEKLCFAAEAVEGLQFGDALNLEENMLVIRKIERMENGFLLGDDDGLDEGSLWLVKGENGDYEAGRYSHSIWRTVGSASFAVAKDAQFLDGIDSQDGEMLENPARHSMEEFLRIKEEEEERGYPGFGCDNVWAAFNAEGEIASLERFYVPWQ